MSSPFSDLPQSLQQEHVSGAKLFANRDELIRSISSERDVSAVAELGVAYGDFSAFILDTLRPSRFDAFDIFKFHEWKQIWGKSSAETLGGKTHIEYYQTRFRPQIEEGIVKIFVGDSSEKLQEQSDRFYDLIYIDGAHDLEGVRKDATASCAKVKDDGYLVFNDYIMHDYFLNERYGVVYVVNELCTRQHWRITHFAFQQGMFCDIALRRSAY